MKVRRGKPILVSAILMAAGESKRMGKPKQLMPFGRSTILEQTVDNLLSSEITEIIVVVGYKAEEMIKTIASRPVKIALNPMYQLGMSTSIVTGLNLINAKTQAVMLALADQPLVDSKTINQLIEEFYNHNKGIAVPAYQGKRGHPVIFSIKYKKELLVLTGDIRGQRVTNHDPDDILEVSVDSESINIDIDNINDYQSLLN